jgi:CDP-diacylglycerol--glycerol-3-phosphate 3-phosphatidyltransferase
MMNVPSNTASGPHVDAPRSHPDAAFFATTSLTFLKPWLKRVCRPIAEHLARMGVTANQVTLASLVGSVAVGSLLCAYPAHPALFALLAVWMPVKTACAAIDGTLAIEFGQKNRLGGVLNEIGDIVSDAALFLPLAFVAPFTTNTIVFLIILIVLSEIAGIIGPSLGSDRRLEGPLGKADRSIILTVFGMMIAALGGLPEGTSILVPVLDAALIITIWNRLRFALADSRNRVGTE